MISHKLTIHSTQQTRTQFVKSVDGGERWTPVGINLRLPRNKEPIDLGLSNYDCSRGTRFTSGQNRLEAQTVCSIQFRVLIRCCILKIYRLTWWRATASRWRVSQTLRFYLNWRRQIGRGLHTTYSVLRKLQQEQPVSFAITGATFYIEYERKLYRCSRGDREWYDTGMQDAPVFGGFLCDLRVSKSPHRKKLFTLAKVTAASFSRWIVVTLGKTSPRIFRCRLIEQSHGPSCWRNYRTSKRSYLRVIQCMCQQVMESPCQMMARNGHISYR